MGTLTLVRPSVFWGRVAFVWSAAVRDRAAPAARNSRREQPSISRGSLMAATSRGWGWLHDTTRGGQGKEFYPWRWGGRSRPAPCHSPWREPARQVGFDQRACSSIGQSSRLIIGCVWVRVPPGPSVSLASLYSPTSR